MGQPINVAYYDPFDANEESYVAQRWSEAGKPPESIAILYATMREWHSGIEDSPLHAAADARLYPDMAYARTRAGLTSYGLAVVRNWQREYRDDTQPTGERSSNE